MFGGALVSLEGVANRPGNGRDHRFRVAERGQRYKKDAILVMVHLGRCCFQGQARLAHPAGSEDGHQADVGFVKQPGQVGQFVFTPD